MRSAGSLVRMSRLKRCLSGSPVSGQANFFPEPSSVTVESDAVNSQKAWDNAFQPSKISSGSPVSGQANLFPEPSSVAVESDAFNPLKARDNAFQPLTNDELYYLLDRFYRQQGRFLIQLLHCSVVFFDLDLNVFKLIATVM